MPFEQAIRLVTQPPESLAYHLIILLSLQVTFSVAFWQWRYDDEAVDSWRLWIAAGAMFLLRLGTAIALTLSTDISQRFLLPPLERAIDLATILLLLWAIIPSLRVYPRLTDSLLLIGLIGVGIGYGLSSTSWNNQLVNDVIYADTGQAVIWAIAHLVLLTSGIIWLVIHRPFDWFLRFLVLVPLVAAQILLLFEVLPFNQFADVLPAEVSTFAIPFWMRLAYVLAFPLVASIAYRQNLAGLLLSRSTTAASIASVESLVNSITTVLSGQNQDEMLERMASLLNDRIRTAFVGFGILLESAPDSMRTVVFDDPENPAASKKEWMLKLSNWTAFQMALRDNNPIELASSGMGARQYFDIKQELNLGINGPILISPVHLKDDHKGHEQQLEYVGVLLVGKSNIGDLWIPSEQTIVRSLAQFFGQALTRLTGGDRPIKILDREGDEAGASSAKFAKLEKEAAQAAALQSEVALLRDSLRTAEEALAVASAGESGLSTEWVTRAITHYSGELEEAQYKISQLEKQLQSIVTGPAFDSLVFVTEEIRTPVTAIQGYVGVLLSDHELNLPFEYRHLLERVQKSAEKIDELMERFDQNVQQVGTLNDESPQSQLIDVFDMVLEALKSSVRENRLTIDLDLPDDLPQINLLARDLYHLIILMLRLIVDSAAAKSKLLVKANQIERYVQLEVHISDPEVVRHLRVEILNEAGSNGLTHSQNGNHDELNDPSVYQLIKRYNTRLWVDSQPDSGTMLIFLFPVVPHLVKE